MQHPVNPHTAQVRQALTNALAGQAGTIADAGEILKAIRGFSSTGNSYDMALLGSFTLSVLLERLQNDLNAQRDSAILVDKLRAI